ncbi:Protein OS-9 [Rhodosporidiobolus nylandii]
MARTLATAAALLLAACPALALSSHSPRDLEAHPAFAVVLSEHYVLNETISELLAEPLGTPPHSSPPKRHLLRSPNGQAFLCTVPAVADEAKRRADVEEEQDALVRAQDVEKGVQNGLALLEPMRGGCLYSKQGWFTYSFCYGNEIRQFHEVRVAGAVGPSEDPNAESYTLGVSPEPAALSATPKYGSGSPELHMKEAQIPSRLGGGDAVGWEEGGRYLIQTFESGTRCDLTGLPRTVEVQYHCSTQSLDRIALVRETSICRYVMIVHTPRLCNEPLFLEGQLKHQEPAATIECQPVVRKLPAQLPQGKVGESASPVEEAAPPATEQLHAHVAGERYTAEAPPSPEPASPPSPDTHRLGDSSAAASAEHEHLSNDPLDGEAMLTLVYDPETGEIESAVTELGEDLFVDSALSRQLFGEHGEAEREQQIVDGQQRVGGQVEAAEVTVDTLAELAKLARPPFSPSAH